MEAGPNRYSLTTHGVDGNRTRIGTGFLGNVRSGIESRRVVDAKPKPDLVLPVIHLSPQGVSVPALLEL